MDLEFWHQRWEEGRINKGVTIRVSGRYFVTFGRSSMQK